MRTFVITAALALILAGGASAQTTNWDFELSAPDQIGLPGTMLVYNGFLSNNTGSPLSLTGLTLDPPAGSSTSNYTIDFAPEFLGALQDTGFAIPTTGYTGPIFDVNLAPAAALGTIVEGSATLSVDIPGDPDSILQPFTATAALPVPEASTIISFGLLLALGLGATAVSVRRRKAQSQ